MYKYEELASELENEIGSALAEGRRTLRTEQQLCEQYGCSRQTVRMALKKLREEGLIATRRGSGSRLTGLMPGKDRNRVVILLNSTTDYIYPDMVSNIRREFRNTGYSVSLFEIHGDFNMERRALNEILAGPAPRGMIVECISDYSNPNADLYQKLLHAGCCLVMLCGRYQNLPDVPCVMDNDYQGGYDAASLLIRMGHTRIAGVFRSDQFQSRGRYLGYLCALRDHGLPFPRSHVLLSDAEDMADLIHSGGSAILDHFVTDVISACTAVLCYNDELACPLIRELTRRGVEVPGDLSVVSFDASYLRTIGPNILVSMGHQQGEPARSAASLLLSRLRGEQQTDIVLPWHICPGTSVSAER